MELVLVALAIGAAIVLGGRRWRRGSAGILGVDDADERFRFAGDRDERGAADPRPTMNESGSPDDRDEDGSGSGDDGGDRDDDGGGGDGGDDGGDGGDD